MTEATSDYLNLPWRSLEEVDADIARAQRVNSKKEAANEHK